MKGTKQHNALVVILVLAVALAIMLAIIVFIRLLPVGKNDGGENDSVDSLLLERQAIHERAEEAYESRGTEGIIEFYDEYINKTNDTNEKIRYLKYRILDLDDLCNWSCEGQILNDLHALYDLDRSEEMIRQICVYEDKYVDSDPVEECRDDLE